MLGYDSPEIKSKNMDEKTYALHSKNVLEQLILNKIVKIECSNIKDKYGRVLAIVYTKMNNQTLNVNNFMVENKLGYSYDGNKKLTFDELKNYYGEIRQFQLETKNFYDFEPCIIL